MNDIDGARVPAAARTAASTLNGSADDDAGASAVSTFANYLLALLPVVLGATEGDLRRSLLQPQYLSATAGSAPSQHSANDASFSSLAARFITDSSLQCVYVNKLRVSTAINASTPRIGSENDERTVGLGFDTPIPSAEASTPARTIYTLTAALTWLPNNIASLALIKRGTGGSTAVLDIHRPLAEQLHFVNLFGPAQNLAPISAIDESAAVMTPQLGIGKEDADTTVSQAAVAAKAIATPYVSLHSIVHLAVQPYFEAYVSRKNLHHADANDATDGDASSGQLMQSSSAGAGDDDDANNANSGIPAAKKKIAELELSLLQLQQNVDIPETILAVHPAIRRAVQRASSQGVRPSPEYVEPASLLSDSTFLNRLQSQVNGWIKDIQGITKLSRDVTSGTASQEINFWLHMETALESIETQLRSDSVLLALDVLKYAKRFHATVSFLADTGLREATEQVHRYNLLMKDFPINDLLSAPDLERLHDALLAVFNHLNKKLKLSPYPIRRALPLVEAISKDLANGILRYLRTRRLMYATYAQFENTLATAAQIFSTWDDLIKEFTNVAREVTRKRAEKFLPIKIVAHHLKDGLQGRIEYLRTFRKHHEQLIEMVSPTQGMISGSSSAEIAGLLLGGVDMEDEVRAAYEQVKHVDVLDTTPEGTQSWVSAETVYNDRVARIENQIIARLRDRLGSSRTASDMFRVFSRFNALFVRPKIRGAIQEYQTTLIDGVKEDIARLHQVFRTQYRNSEAYHLCQLRDLPPVAGAIMWAKQIERQLNIYMKRVEDVLGRGWEHYAEGAKLASESAAFKRKLDTRYIYEAWLSNINKRDMHVMGRVFEVTRTRKVTYDDEADTNGLIQPNGVDGSEYDDEEADDNATYELSINFDPHVITLFKEVRNLLWAGYSVPHSINNVAKDAKRVYPYAVSLMETVRTYTQTLQHIDSTPEVQPLLSEYHGQVQELLAKGITLRWEVFVNIFDTRHAATALPISSEASQELANREGRHAAYVRELATAVSNLQDRSIAVLSLFTEMQAQLDKLQKCPYERNAFQAVLQEIQKGVDKLSLDGYANLPAWVVWLDDQIQQCLTARLQAVIDHWCSSMAPEQTGEQMFDTTLAHLQIVPAQHDIRIRNQQIYVDPPLEAAQASYFAQLQSWLGIVCHLTRIQSQRYAVDVKAEGQDKYNGSYICLLQRLASDDLRRPYDAIEDRLRDLRVYVDKWLEFQALWDLEADYLYNTLGDDQDKWQQLLLEIRKTRSTFDTAETQHSLGVAVVTYDQVQAKVNAKYDAWQRDILVRFGQKLGFAIRDQHSEILKARRELELQSTEASNTATAVVLITFVQTLKDKTEVWAKQLDLHIAGQKTLERQRYQFPSDWLSVDQLQLDWAALMDILTRKDNVIKEQISGLQVKVLAEDKIVADKVAAVIESWNQDKPIAGGIQPEVALESIASFEDRAANLHNSLTMLAQAKAALGLASESSTSVSHIVSEIRDFKTVWTALSGIWTQIEHLRSTLWTNVQARKLRQSLDGLLSSTRELPSKLRQYAAFEYVQDRVRALLKCNAVVTELKAESLRDRHWRQIYKALNISRVYSATTVTLGDVWDLDLRTNETFLKGVIAQAQGEMALEEYIKQVKEVWTSYNLDLVNYQNKVRLIRGWDELFAQCSDHLSAIAAMRLSPYFRIFEEDANLWEDRLNRIHILFDVWVDAQRQWVYLEGIFANSADIKHLLPVETARFNNINTEFMSVMKKVLKSPFVLDVLNIEGIQKSIERLADLLAKIQKALGEYLEKERAGFPRFYFLGDEDLLELIGNSKDLARAGKHLKKMFAGIQSVVARSEDEGASIEAFSSKEGEDIRLLKPISLAETPKIKEWLSLLESGMKLALADQLLQAIEQLRAVYSVGSEIDAERFLSWIDCFPAQVVLLALQISWTDATETCLVGKSTLQPVLDHALHGLDLLADAVLTDMPAIQRAKCEGLITELVHQRDVLRSLSTSNIDDSESFEWLQHLRFYLDATASNPVDSVIVRMAGAEFRYGFEYLGATDRLVQTPLTDRCYLTLTQALAQNLGGSPFGPAGTGKTESVKALGQQLGRFVLVFCCDETFDFQAVGRIFVGLCQVGAWGCFDEFNRLEEKMLSAVSQQIQAIQLGLKARAANDASEIDLVDRRIKVNLDTGIFITMNPGYAGRSNLPDNLKKLFRSIAIARPDQELIAQVMLFSKGFRSAEVLAGKIIPFFNLCLEQLSAQPHYDFGLRALKSVLSSAGRIKRQHSQRTATFEATATIAEEAGIIVQSIRESVVPKLVRDDVQLLAILVKDVFPDAKPVTEDLGELRTHIISTCETAHLSTSGTWMSKVLQLYQVQQLHHGLMLVGPAASGKSSAWRTLLRAMELVDKIEGVSYVIDPKAISKEQIYGSLDITTREWTDGLFTSIIRRVIDNVRGEAGRRHWIIFDGDVDPEWVENLNSVLDDNKLLTLPNGERLAVPENVRIIFETESLKYATLATVSRCGMIWLSEDTVTSQMLCASYLQRMSTHLFATVAGSESEEAQSTMLALQAHIADKLKSHFEANGTVASALAELRRLSHIMEASDARALSTLFSTVDQAMGAVHEYNLTHPDFPLTADRCVDFMEKKFILGLLWACAGDASLAERSRFDEFIRKVSSVALPPPSAGQTCLDYTVELPAAEWLSWQTIVPTIELETHAVLSSDVIIPTLDTLRHESILYTWLADHRPLLLCGPPGSGKTMTLFNALRKLPDIDVIGLNFSSATTPELLLKTFEQYCEYRKTPRGLVLAPTQIGRWLVMFCDEINLPALDKYGTQRVISFLRQLVEQSGFWRSSDKSWVTVERIQFVGACNPPTDPGRIPLTQRFLRHVPLIMVDYPAPPSLRQIYSTFNRAVLKVIPSLRVYADPLTDAMVDVYAASQSRFTQDVQPHYVYSPRELTRWVRGLYEAIKPMENLSLEGLIRIWAHEALRLFSDRLVDDEERLWTSKLVDATAAAHFTGADLQQALHRPILFSNWTSRHYLPIEQEVLREFTKARLRTFYEEELDVPLVLFDDVLEHVLRIDRVMRQSQGHMLLIGVSGCGKTTLSRFVAWINGLSIFQVKVHNKYTAADFDEDLRHVLRRAGCRGEKICFIMDESNVLDAGFLERMNTLLANSEVPGLFDGDEYASLMTACKEGAQRDGLLLDTPEELYKWFTQQIARNLHVVFTMNPPQAGSAAKATTSPALFNRCVIDWFGDWPSQALQQVADEYTQALDLTGSDSITPTGTDEPVNVRSAIVNICQDVHKSIDAVNKRMASIAGRTMFLTPRHYLDFINQFVKLFTEKQGDLQDQERHLNVGLEKLRATVEQVAELRKSLDAKQAELSTKNAEANEKLQKMLVDQRDAEFQKLASIDIQAELQVQEGEIKTRREVVLRDLALAEPAVLDAQAAVTAIKKQQLAEVRSMANPPEAVKLALESVCIMLGHQVDSWRTIQSIIRSDDFIARIFHFDTEKSLTTQLRALIQRDYLSRPAYTYEAANRASKACGPLVKWVLAQIGFSDILDKVGPLRNEVSALEQAAVSTQKKATTITVMIQEIEERIEQYKAEYAILIAGVQRIKSEMEKVHKKVDRSIKLLDSLQSERVRWDESSTHFNEQLATLSGDSLLAAAFLAYAGPYDEGQRQQLWDKWSSLLHRASIGHKVDLSVIELLSNADDRLRWQSNVLQTDNLSMQNAIMLKRHSRYPLVIDPDGQAIAFITQEYAEKKIRVTSFLDEAFVKTLESALRFGTAILVTDAEYLNAIVNPVLNKELRRTGGRNLIRIGSQDIDYSPSFSIILTTRNSNHDFPPDICSRTCMINFTMTKSSLQNQSLSQILRSEYPAVEERRKNALRLQGEFHARLRQLEKALLQALNDSEESILDDENVVKQLESIKSEAAEITRKMKDAENTMADVSEVTAVITPLASVASALYFLLDNLSTINHFYRFSTQFFREIFDHMLVQSKSLPDKSLTMQRITAMSGVLLREAYRRASRALLSCDKPLLALLLAHIHVNAAGNPLNEHEWNEFTEMGSALSRSQRAPAGVDIELPKPLQPLKHLHGLRALLEHFAAQPTELQSIMKSDQPESGILSIVKQIERTSVFHAMLLVKTVRPDRTAAAAQAFATSILATDFQAASDDLSQMVSADVTASSPICLASVTGYDAGFRVDNLVNSLGSRCRSVAMGSREGFTLAEEAMSSAARTGDWVLLKNVHLTPQWLATLEKRLQTLKPHQSFRLFLTTETLKTVPANVLRCSRIVMNERPPGIRAGMIECLRSVGASNSATGGIAERFRLYFALAWLQAVLSERLRFVPTGFTKAYEFNDSDFNTALTIIDRWTSASAQGRSNVDPANLPYKAIRTLLKQAVYGGRIETEMDQAILDGFIDSLFSQAIYDSGFQLTPAASTDGRDALLAPEDNRVEGMLSWCKTLPERQPPTWVGLPANAESVLAQADAKAFLAKLRALRIQSEDEDTVADDVHPAATGKAAGEHMHHGLDGICRGMLASLPVSLDHESSALSSPSPLATHYLRELDTARALLARMRSDLQQVLAVSEGQVKQTNDVRRLISELTAGVVPATWKAFKTVSSISLSAWMDEFARRLKHVQELSRPLSDTPVWLGGLFRPAAWITATRQQSARAQGVSLEQLQLQLHIYDDAERLMSDSAGTQYPIRGLCLQSAAWSPDGLVLNDGTPTHLEHVAIRWVPMSDGGTATRSRFNCPIYLNGDRSHLLFTIPLPSSELLTRIAQQGVCITANNVTT